MASSAAAPQRHQPVSPPGCPAWCTSRHSTELGEEDVLHLGEPLEVADGVLAQLCMSRDGRTGVQDGPYVLIGATEYTAGETARLGRCLIALAETAHRS